MRSCFFSYLAGCVFECLHNSNRYAQKVALLLFVCLFLKNNLTLSNPFTDSLWWQNSGTWKSDHRAKNKRHPWMTFGRMFSGYNENSIVLWITSVSMLYTFCMVFISYLIIYLLIFRKGCQMGNNWNCSDGDGIGTPATSHFLPLTWDDVEHYVS